MPLYVTIGFGQDLEHRARKLLRENGAIKTELVGSNLVMGTYRGIADPEGARADLLVDCLNVDMKQDRFSGLWLDDVAGSC
jgi:hypothetical protein